MRHFGRSALFLFCILSLAACNSGPVKRIFPPTANIQQLTIQADGGWEVNLQLHNYSNISTHFESVALQLMVADQLAGTLQGTPSISVGPESADLITLTLQPDVQARLLLADVLSNRRSLAYSLQGKLNVLVGKKKKPEARSYELDIKNRLNPAPGLEGVLR